jgi:uncharacterized protein (DUF885 family)
MNCDYIVTDDIARLADKYFVYLAQHFPVMCASDEFHFLPRAQAAAAFYDRMDNLESQAVQSVISNLKSFRNKFGQMADQDSNLEDRIDLKLLQANAAGIMIELDLKQSWKYNPLLYLKIAFIGLDHALNKPADSSLERSERVLARLAAIPVLLKQATNNIGSVPQTYHQASRTMLLDCRRYLKQSGNELLAVCDAKHAEMLKAYLNRAAAALQSLDDHLSSVKVEPDGRFATSTLNETLKNHFLNVRNVDEIYQLAVEDWHDNLEKLESLKIKTDAKASWQDLYHNYLPPEVNTDNTFELYQHEIERLRHFFNGRGFNLEDLNRTLEVAETPHYLNSVRGAASFAAAFSADKREKSYFYITTHLAKSSTDLAGVLLKKRFHREFKMLTAHETIPGHHFLDSIRCRLKNPVRRQIESPLFYEGWASYAEFLLVDSGYVHRPMDLIVDYKRRLWRSARCQVDVGLSTGKIGLRDAMDLLKVCGFAIEEAQRQIDRFRLNPGYQLCYSLGCHEFKQLKTLWGHQMTEIDFHTFLLEGGELPFHLIEERFDNFSALNDNRI